MPFYNELQSESGSCNIKLFNQKNEERVKASQLKNLKNEVKNEVKTSFSS